MFAFGSASRLTFFTNFLDKIGKAGKDDWGKVVEECVLADGVEEEGAVAAREGGLFAHLVEGEDEGRVSERVGASERMRVWVRAWAWVRVRVRGCG